MNISQREALRESGFTEVQTTALVMALEPLATKEDLRVLSAELRGDLAAMRKDHEGFRGDLAVMRKDHEGFRGDLEALRGDLAVMRKDHEGFRGDLAVIRNDMRWMKWVGGAIGIAVLTEILSGSFS